MGLSLSPQVPPWGTDVQWLLLASKQTMVPSFPSQSFASQLSLVHDSGGQRKVLLASHSPLSSESTAEMNPVSRVTGNFSKGTGNCLSVEVESTTVSKGGRCKLSLSDAEPV